MSLELLILFAIAMLAAALGQLGIAGAAAANAVCAVSLAIFLVALPLRGVRKPVV